MLGLLHQAFSSSNPASLPSLLPSLMFQTGTAVSGLAVQPLLNYVASLYLLLIAIFQGRNEKGETGY